IMAMYTDPQRLKATDPGSIENNPLWIFHDTFNPDKTWVEEAKARYQEGRIGDVECKKRLVEVLTAFIAPLHQKRLDLEKNKDYVKSVLKAGAEKANATANETLRLVKEALHQIF
ncbi:MAG: tryptophan--tRNA ligase, partial [Gammaproteobacteria bacterium]|nr:tryptophan--tRNA ligase [Gammaproteobacteria bacterium]